MKIYGKLSVAHKVNNKKAGYLYFLYYILCVYMWHWWKKKEYSTIIVTAAVVLLRKTEQRRVINGINFQATFYCINKHRIKKSKHKIKGLAQINPKWFKIQKKTMIKIFVNKELWSFTFEFFESRRWNKR